MHVLDSHLHLWDPELFEYPWLAGPLDRRFADREFEHVRREFSTLGTAAVEKAIFVQAETVEGSFLEEVRWVSEMGPALGVVGIVAGIRLDCGADTVAHLDRLDAEPLVVGVRHNLQGEAGELAASAGFMTGAREVAQRGLTFDACVHASQLPEIARLAGAIPELRIVLDHLGKPAVGTASAPHTPSTQWTRDLVELAQYPNTCCKLSGLPGEAGGQWSAAQLEPFLDAAADAFGVERLVWGSDWPVSAMGSAETGDPHAPQNGALTYQPTARSRWAETVIRWAESREYDLEAILCHNGERFYGIAAPTSTVGDPARRR